MLLVQRDHMVQYLAAANDIGADALFVPSLRGDRARSVNRESAVARVPARGRADHVGVRVRLVGQRDRPQ